MTLPNAQLGKTLLAACDHVLPFCSPPVHVVRVYHVRPPHSLYFFLRLAISKEPDQAELAGLWHLDAICMDSRRLEFG